MKTIFLMMIILCAALDIINPLTISDLNSNIELKFSCAPTTNDSRRKPKPSPSPSPSPSTSLSIMNVLS